MKILVAIKRVVDHSVRVRPNSQATAMDIANAKMTINPFCEIALEEAVRLKEQGIADEVVVVDAGRIVQRGPHAELVRVDGVYRRLHDSWVAQHEHH